MTYCLLCYLNIDSPDSHHCREFPILVQGYLRSIGGPSVGLHDAVGESPEHVHPGVPLFRVFLAGGSCGPRSASYMSPGDGSSRLKGIHPPILVQMSPDNGVRAVVCPSTGSSACLGFGKEWYLAVFRICATSSGPSVLDPFVLSRCTLMHVHPEGAVHLFRDSYGTF